MRVDVRPVVVSLAQRESEDGFWPADLVSSVGHPRPGSVLVHHARITQPRLRSRVDTVVDVRAQTEVVIEFVHERGSGSRAVLFGHEHPVVGRRVTPTVFDDRR